MHENAHGCSLLRKNLPLLINYMNTELKEDAFDNCYVVDFILDAKQFTTPDVIKELAIHENCYGNGVDEPHLIIKNLSLENILIMGENKDCIRITNQKINYVRFKDTDFIQQVLDNRINKNLTIYGKVNLNRFQGQTSAQVFIDDYEFVDDSNKFDF